MKHYGLLKNLWQNYFGALLKNLFNSGELAENSTTEDFSIVQQEGKRNVTRIITFYNLDAVISVGYRVNSTKATKFRIWATGVLKDIKIKCFYC